MGRTFSMTRLGGVFAAVMLTAWTASAEPLLMAAPIAKPALTQDYFALPKFDFSTVDPGKFRKEPPQTSFDTIDLGGAALRMDIAEGLTPPTPDTPDLTNVIVPLAPGKKRTTPRYFGLKFSTPTH
jgi:hypothetical protein